MKLFNLFRLLIDAHDQTPNYKSTIIDIGPLVFIILAIIIIIMIIVSKNKYKKDKKTVFLNFLIAFMIIPSCFFLGNENLVLIPENSYIKKATENYDYIINAIEETSKLKIIIEAKTEIKELEFTIKFYNKSDQLLYADSNKLTDLENGYYKTFEFDKPTEILLNGGKYNLSHNASKSFSQMTDFYIESDGFVYCIMIGLILGTIVAIITNVIKKADIEDEEYPFLCEKCNTINHKDNHFCSKCGNELIPKDIKICNKCKTKNPKENLFCLNCGNQLENSKNTITCPHCKTKNPQKNYFCYNCHKRINYKEEKSNIEDRG